MQITSIILFFLIGFLFFYVYKNNKQQRDADTFLLKRTTALFWAIKNKKLIDFKDWKEAEKIAEGKKEGKRSLQDFIDMTSE